MKSNKTKAQFFFVSSLVSVIASVFLYSIYTDKSIGIFVGLWAPTLMGLSNRYGISHTSEVAESKQEHRYNKV